MTGINQTRTYGASGRTRGGWQQSGSGGRGNGAPRAKWVSQEVRAARQAAGACIRCGHKGHFVAECTFAPATRPAPQGQRRVDIRALEAEEWREDTYTSDEEGGEQGKE